MELLAALREGDHRGACRWTFDSLKSGNVHAQTVWDAVFVSAAELRMTFVFAKRQPDHIEASLSN